MQIHTIEANGLRFAYHEAGEGPLVLLLHGFPDTARTWDAFLGPIAALGYRVVAPYLRGYAPTAVPPRDTTQDDLGRDVLGLIEALGAESAVLVGHDWGAQAVLAAASMAPERVTKLATLAIPHPLALKPSLSLLWGGRHFFTLTWPGAGGRFRARGFQGLRTLYRRWAPSWQASADDLADVTRCFSEPGALSAALGYYRAFSFISPPAFFRTKLPMPSIAIAGSEDLIPLAAFHSASRAFTGSYEVLELPCGHFPHREKELEVLEALQAFLGQA